MFKQLIAAVLGLFVAAVFAASVDVNKATVAELESIKGVGPGIATKILDERKKASFKDWGDLVDRVKGIGEGNAAKFSTAGLTVNGAAFKPTAAAPAAKKDDMKAKAATSATPATPATPAVKTEAKSSATPATPATPAMPAASAKKADATAQATAAKAAAADEAKKAKAATQTAKAAAAKASEPAKK